MLASVFATKLGMTQAWTQSGKRLPVTKCKAELHRVITVRDEKIRDITTRTPELITVKQVVLGYGNRPLKRLTKPLQGILTKQGFFDGVKKMISMRLDADADTSSIALGSTVALETELAVGDIVDVQGTSKGRGYAGVVKRHGFHGGPATHGQSDRERAPGSIGQRTTPGRVFKNQRMAGHFGVEARTVTGLVILHIDYQTGEIWLSGPVPGSVRSLLKITKTGAKKEIVLHERTAPKTTTHTTDEVVAESPVVETNGDKAEVIEVSDSTQEGTQAIMEAVAAESAPTEEKQA